MATIRTELRLPEEMHAQIKALAEGEMRSMNAQIVSLLKQALAAQARPAEPEQGLTILRPRTRIGNG